MSTAAWLTLSPASGLGPARWRPVSLPRAWLPGTYNAHDHRGGLRAAAQSVAVALTVAAAPAIGASPAALSFTATAGRRQSRRPDRDHQQHRRHLELERQ
mgnify:CR=1 FL=1